MKNSYLIAGLVLVVVILGVFLRSKKIEAPLAIEKDFEKVGVTALVDGDYKLDTNNSVISWEGEFVNGMSEKGTFKLTSGQFTIKGGIIDSGEFEIDMNSIDSIPHKDRLVAHLKSADFFETETYPTAKFILKKMIPSSEEGAKVGRYVIAGDLVMKGITKPISFTTTLTGGQNGLNASASFAINRADWEVKYNSATFFKDLGDKIIRDAVTIGLDLKGTKVIQ